MKRTLSIITTVIFALILIISAVPAVTAAEQTKIVRSPSTYTVPQGHSVTYLTEAEGTGLTFDWYIRYKGLDYPLMPTQDTAGAEFRSYYSSVEYNVDGNEATVTLNDVKIELDGAQIYCIVRGQNGTAVTSRAYVTVSTAANCVDATPFSIKNLVWKQNELCKYAVKITEESGYNYRYDWYETSVNELSTIMISPDTDDSKVFIVDTSNPGTKYYVCMVTKTSEDGKKVNISYSNVARFTIYEADSDPSYTMGIEITKKPSVNEYVTGMQPALDGISVRATTGQGYYDLSAEDISRLEIYPNNICTSELNRLTVSYDGCEASFPISVAGASKFSIYAVSEQEYSTYYAGQPFTLEAGAKDANSSVKYRWYMSDENGFKGELVDEGAEFEFKDGIPASMVNEMQYYLCVGECDGVTSELLFTVILLPMGIEETEPPVQTDVPATDVPATDVPATDEPSTDVPGTDGPADETQPPADATENTDNGNKTAEPQSTGDNQSGQSGNSSDKKALNTGLILGIAIGLFVAALAALIVSVVLSVKKKK